MKRIKAEPDLLLAAAAAVAAGDDLDETDEMFPEGVDDADFVPSDDKFVQVCFLSQVLGQRLALNSRMIRL